MATWRARAPFPIRKVDGDVWRPCATSLTAHTRALREAVCARTRAFVCPCMRACVCACMCTCECVLYEAVVQGAAGSMQHGVLADQTRVSTSRVRLLGTTARVAAMCLESGEGGSCITLDNLDKPSPPSAVCPYSACRLQPRYRNWLIGGDLESKWGDQ